VGYGDVGGARAIEVLRGVAIELHMAPIKPEVNIAMEPFLGTLSRARHSTYIVKSRDAVFGHMVWWGETLKAGRQATPAADARSA
jgi:hypothetical protein